MKLRLLDILEAQLLSLAEGAAAAAATVAAVKALESGEETAQGAEGGPVLSEADIQRVVAAAGMAQDGSGEASRRRRTFGDKKKQAKANPQE